MESLWPRLAELPLVGGVVLIVGMSHERLRTICASIGVVAIASRFSAERKISGRV
jgi:hypothetical protein